MVHDYAYEVANTIYQQLGGGRFKAMVGADRFAFGIDPKTHEPFMTCRFKMHPKINTLKVYYTAADLYRMEFAKFTPGRFIQKTCTFIEPKYAIVSTHDDVYFDQLQELFTQETGLLTRLF